MKNIYQILDHLEIAYQKHEHPAVATVEEADKYYDSIQAGHSKNIFLRNKKGDKHYLVIIPSSKRLNIRNLELLLNERNLSFASPDRLEKYLGLKPGAVSPFGLINDTSKEVHVIVDNELVKHEKIGFHPNVNTATLVISSNDFKKFLKRCGNKVMYIDL